MIMFFFPLWGILSAVFYVSFLCSCLCRKIPLQPHTSFGCSTLSGHWGRVIHLFIFAVPLYFHSVFFLSSWYTSMMSALWYCSRKERWRRVKGVAPPTWFSLYGLRWCEAHTARMTIIMSRAPQDARIAMRVLLSVGVCWKKRKNPEMLPCTYQKVHLKKTSFPSSHPPGSRPPTLLSSS